MLGVMLVRKEELKFREFDRYRAYYCGLCRTLGKRTGIASRMALSFEMTFLGLLLTSLYEPETREEHHRCPVHPAKRRQMLQNSVLEYCADLSALTAYYDLLDGWQDEHRVDQLAASGVIQKAAKESGARWPRQKEAVERYVNELHKVEASGDDLLDTAANLTGEMLAELYVMEEDFYSPDLRTLGFGIGKFIYLSDSYEDIEKDIKHGNYNPLISRWKQPGFDEHIKEVLDSIMAETAAAFERLPLLLDAEIMRNILYSGMWQRFEATWQRRQEKEKRAREKSESSETSATSPD